MCISPTPQCLHQAQPNQYSDHETELISHNTNNLSYQAFIAGASTMSKLKTLQHWLSYRQILTQGGLLIKTDSK
ncbi:hypothetical protein A0J61_05201 [Choanephora cucurbitarum]|uniref:Uncharacterized protein n=1 Tax=Choanephora cucurbitarum TaxID=101091 RepID=A0A1C7NH99_9FUNG|nr:hypothetical protein A0J61_05201 [Choanephora cucurbitarum]